MRVNLPVTQIEHPLDAGGTLLSVTDPQGRIVYCNAAFVAASGFTRDELMGQPHNLVRHPDMPAEAFRDLWSTIESGLPWTAVVKNRRKDGNHYWVRANATAIRADGRIVGFLSVREPASRDEVASAEALYARMRDEAERGAVKLGLHRGRLVRTDRIGRVAQALQSLPRQVGLDGLMTLAATAAAAALATWAPAWASVPASALAVAACVVVSRRAALAPLAAMRDASLSLASGDLSARMPTGAHGTVGDLQAALAQMTANLRTVVGDVGGEMAQMRHAAREIAAGNHDLSSRTEAQASSLEQTAASMEQIDSTVKNNAGSAKSGVELAMRTAEMAERSDEAVAAVVQAMGNIDTSSRQIGAIVETIEGIAFQTNILALNAAVEAARAGESGRGFAVVASEVRTLAQRCSHAAHEIRDIVAESATHVTAGRSQTRQAAERMQEMLQSSRGVARVLQDIGQAAVEQELGVSQITDAVTHMDSLTQQNAAMVEQLDAAARSLEDQVRIASPARAASIAAFRASRLVCIAMARITPPIFSMAFAPSARCCTVEENFVTVSSMSLMRRRTRASSSSEVAAASRLPADMRAISVARDSTVPDRSSTRCADSARARACVCCSPER